MNKNFNKVTGDFYLVLAFTITIFAICQVSPDSTKG
jgi:hypothetical protein